MAVKHPIWTIVSTWKSDKLQNKTKQNKTSTVISHKHEFLKGTKREI